MEEQLMRLLNIRYIKLHFTVMTTEPSVLPRYKASAIRGGLGQMLLKANCIRDRNCESCDFVSECIVRRIMYPKMERVPEFMRSNDSAGYVIECENYRERFDEGECWNFNLILFGNTLCYFNICLQALAMLGQAGIGKNHAPFRVVSITNSRKEDILDQNGNIYMERYKTKQVADYVRYRKKQINTNGLEGRIKFQTPLSVKYQGSELKQFHMEAVLLACARRIYMLDCLEGLDVEKYLLDQEEVPEINEQAMRPVHIPRYSTRHDAKMVLKGIEGTVCVEYLTEEQLILLLAGELLHIGKHTSFGFGRLRVM